MTPGFSKFPRALWRRRRRTTALAIAVCFVLFAPFLPYFPRCYEGGSFESVGPFLAEPYRSELAEALEIHDVPHLQIGGLVLLRSWDWLVDPEQWVLNASNKSIRFLLYEKPARVADDIPEHVRALAELHRQPGEWYAELRCDLVQAVANEGW